MKNNEIANFFKQMSHELNEMNDSEVPYNEYDNIFADWKQKLIPKIEGTYKIKIKRIDTLTYDNYPILQTILRDMYFKHNGKKQKNKVMIASEKLLKAREKNIDFESELAVMITGEDNIFPYRKSSQLTKFFQDLGYSFVHNGNTRKEWVEEKLLNLNILEVHTIISEGLFKKKYFIEYAEILNTKAIELDQHPSYTWPVTADECQNKATKVFQKFIKNSIVADEAIDLTFILDMNINIELLFDNKATTNDKELNELIEESKDRFLNKDDKQIALEKLWDAFERLKTYFSGLNKKESASRIVDTISKDFDKDFINDEFKKLTDIGNDYRIRHHEQNKLELTNNHINYFFFRMLTLIDLCLVYLNEENEEL